MDQYNYNQSQDSQRYNNPYGDTYNTGINETKSRKGLIAGIVIASGAVIAAIVVVVLLLTGTIGGKNRIASAQTTSSRSSSRTSSSSGSMRSRIVSSRNSSEDAGSGTANSEDRPTGSNAGKTEEQDTVTEEDIVGYYVINDLVIDGVHLGESGIEGFEVQLAFLPGGEGWISDNLDGGYRSVKPVTWTVGTFQASGGDVRHFTWEGGMITITDEAARGMEMVLAKQEGEIPERPLSDIRENAFGIGNLTEESDIRVTVRVAGTDTWQERNRTDVLPYGTMTTADVADLGDARYFDVRVEMVDLDNVTYYYYNVEMINGYNLMIVADDDGHGGYTEPLGAVVTLENGSYELIAAYGAE